MIDYCADLGLLCKDLMPQDIITSVGIQKRYYKIAVKLMKRRLYSTEYWLLDENGEPLLSSPKNQIDSEETRIVSEEINHSSEGIPHIKKSKEKETKNIEEKSLVSEESLNQAVIRYIEHRERLRKPMGEEAVSMMLGELERIGADTVERIEILNRSVMNGWVGIYPLKERKGENGDRNKGNQFQRFPQRDVDYDSIVMQRLQEGQDGGDRKK